MIIRNAQANLKTKNFPPSLGVSERDLAAEQFQSHSFFVNLALEYYQVHLEIPGFMITFPHRIVPVCIFDDLRLCGYL
jgi:hypothetical protein